MLGSFNLSELKTLCFNLGFTHEEFSGENTRIDTSRELISYLDRRNRLNDLLLLLQRERPTIDWPSLFESPTNERYATSKQMLPTREDDVVRNSIWNALYESLWSKKTFLNSHKAQPPLIDRFSARLWINYFKKPVDSRPQEPKLILQEIRNHFFSCNEVEFYKYLEFILNYWSELHHYQPEKINRAVNLALEKEGTNRKYIPQFEYPQWNFERRHNFITGKIVVIDPTDVA